MFHGKVETIIRDDDPNREVGLATSHPALRELSAFFGHVRRRQVYVDHQTYDFRFTG